MTSAEFREWQLFSIIEPFGSQRDDQRFGMVAAAATNVHLKKGAKPVQPSDFFPPFEKRHKTTQTWQEQLQIVEMLNIAFGGKDLRKPRIE